MAQVKVVIPLKHVFDELSEAQYGFINDLGLGLKGALEEVARMSLNSFESRYSTEMIAFHADLKRFVALFEKYDSYPKFDEEEAATIYIGVIRTLYKGLYRLFLRAFRKLDRVSGRPAVTITKYQELDDSVYVTVEVDFAPF